MTKPDYLRVTVTGKTKEVHTLIDSENFTEDYLGELLKEMIDAVVKAELNKTEK